MSFQDDLLNTTKQLLLLALGVFQSRRQTRSGFGIELDPEEMLKPGLSTAKPLGGSPVGACSTRITSALALTRAVATLPCSGGRKSSTWTAARAGGQEVVTIKAPDSLMSRVTPSPLDISCSRSSQENTALALSR